MKIIQGLKSIKELQRKIDDICEKISVNCADLEIDKPNYNTPEAQKAQVAEWLQSIHDMVKEVMRLRIAIQRTNLSTLVRITIADVEVEHNISEWIHRRRDLAEIEKKAWSFLTDRGIRPQAYSPSGKKGAGANAPEDVQIAKVRKYYDQKQKDQKVEEYTSEPAIIDAKLEVVNAETDLIE